MNWCIYLGRVDRQKDSTVIPTPHLPRGGGAPAAGAGSSAQAFTNSTLTQLKNGLAG